MKRNATASDLMRNRFEIARKALKWSQREVSNRAGLASATHYGLLLSGRVREIKWATAEAIAAAFAKEGFSLDWLLFGQGEMRGAGTVVAAAFVRAKLLSALIEHLTAEFRKLYKEEGAEFGAELEDEVVGDAIDVIVEAVDRTISGHKALLRSIRARHDIPPLNPTSAGSVPPKVPAAPKPPR